MDSPTLAVVLINYNNEYDTVACLDTLAEQSYNDFQTIVVDNGSSRESFEYVRDRFDFPTYLRNDENLGFTGGNNVGIRHALDLGASHVLLLNNDTEVAPSFLEDLMSAADDLPEDAGVIGPKIHTYDSGELWAAGAELNELTASTEHRAGDESQYDEPEHVDYVVGAALLARAEVFEKVGLLDDDFFIYYGETEFCYRARRAGWEVWYVPVDGIFHKENNEFTHSPFRDYLFTRNRCLFVKKTQGAEIKFPFYLYFLVRWILLQPVYLLVAQRDWNAASAAFRGGISGILGGAGEPRV